MISVLVWLANFGSRSLAPLVMLWANSGVLWGRCLRLCYGKPCEPVPSDFIRSAMSVIVVFLDCVSVGCVSPLSARLSWKAQDRRGGSRGRGNKTKSVCLSKQGATPSQLGPGFRQTSPPPHPRGEGRGGEGKGHPDGYSTFRQIRISCWLQSGKQAGT